MTLAFINLNKQNYNFDFPNDMDPLIKDAYTLSLIMETDDIYITFLNIDHEIRAFATLKSPMTLFCDEFTFRSVVLKTQVSVKEYAFDNMEIPECKYRRVIENFIDINKKDRIKIVIGHKVTSNMGDAEPGDFIRAKFYEWAAEYGSCLKDEIKKVERDSNYTFDKFRQGWMPNESTGKIEICVKSHKNTVTSVASPNWHIPNIIQTIGRAHRKTSMNSPLKEKTFKEKFDDYIRVGIDDPELLCLDYERIARDRLYEMTCSDNNILVLTKKNPELSLRLIDDFELKFDDKSFDDLDKKTLDRYRELELHKHTKYLPRKYLGMENVYERFANRDKNLFLEHPNLLVFLNYDKHDDTRILGDLCQLTPFRFLAIIYEFIKNDRVSFFDLDKMTYDEIVETKIYELTDCNGANVLHATRHNPEITIELISNFNVEFTRDRAGESAFGDLNKNILKKYYDLGLHEYTKDLPEEYFSLFLCDKDIKEIEYITQYFKDMDADLFLEYPETIKYLTFDDFGNEDFFTKICNATCFDYYANMYAIDIAIAYQYEHLIKFIKFGTGFVLDRSPDEWKLLSENSMLYLLRRETESSDPEEIIKVAFVESYTKVIDYMFQINDPYPELKLSRYHMRDVPRETYYHMMEKYPDYRGVFGKYGLAALCMFRDFGTPVIKNNTDLDDIDGISEYGTFTKNQYGFLLSLQYRYSDKFYENCGIVTYDTNVLKIHPPLIKHIENGVFGDMEFFGELANIKEKVFKLNKIGHGVYEEEYGFPIFIAMQYNYKQFIDSEDHENLPYYLRWHNDIDVFIKLYHVIQEPLLKEEVIRTLIAMRHDNIIKIIELGQEIILDIRISLNQEEYDLLVANFPKIEIENPYDGESAVGLYYYGVYHRLKNLPEYELDWCYCANILILHKLENDFLFFNYLESLFPNQMLYNSFFDFELFESDRQQYLQQYLPLLKKFAPMIEERFGHLHEEHYSTF